MTVTFERDLESVKFNKYTKHLGQRRFSSNVIARTHTHTHPTDCSTWTNKMVGIEMAINQCCHLVVTNKMLLLGIIILKLFIPLRESILTSVFRNPVGNCTKIRNCS